MKMDANSRLIGKRIKFRREAAGLSQEQLAERLELSKNHISSIECGKSMVTTKGLLALCDVLGGTPNYYLIGELSARGRFDHVADPASEPCGAKNADPASERLSGAGAGVRSEKQKFPGGCAAPKDAMTGVRRAFAFPEVFYENFNL